MHPLGWTSFLLLWLVCGWGGWQLVRAFRPSGLTPLDSLAVVLLSGTLFPVLLALALADGGHFGLRNVWIGALALAAAGTMATGRACMCRRRPIPPQAPEPSGTPPGETVPPRATDPANRPRRWWSHSGVHLACLLTLGVLVFARPFQYLRGGWDPGEYVSSALNLNRTGRLGVVDSFYASLDPDVQPAFCQNDRPPRRTLQPGYLILNDETGQLIPDYHHLYPTWLGLFAGIGGLPGVYSGQTAISLLALAMLFLFTRMACGTLPALLTGILFILNPASAYFARFPTAEMLTLFSLFGGLYFAGRSIEKPDAAFDLLAALSFGAAVLAHITSLTALAGILVFLGFRYVRHPDRARLRLVILVGLGVTVAVVRNAWQTPVLTTFFIQDNLLKRPGMTGSLLAAAVILGTASLWGARRWNRPSAPDAGRLRGGQWAVAGGLALLGLWLYFVRPMVSSSPEAINLRLVAWGLSPIGVWLAFGFFFAKPWGRWRPALGLLVLAGLATSAVLLYHKQVRPLYFWGLRRYVPLVFPFFTLLAASVLADGLSHGRRALRVAAAGLLVLILAFQVKAIHPVLAIREYEGLPGFLQRVAHRLQGADLILCDHFQYVTPLRFAFGLPAYHVARQAWPVDADRNRRILDLLRDQAGRKENVYFLSHHRPFAAPGLELTPAGSESIETSRLRLERSRLPRAPVTETEQAYVYRVRTASSESPVAAFPFIVETGYSTLGLAGGFHAMQRRGEAVYRWTDGRGRVYVPMPGGAVDIHLRLTASRAAGMVPEVPVNILLNDQWVADLTVGADWHTHVITLPDPGPDPVQILTLASPVWNPAEQGLRGYATNLGILVDWIRIEPRENQPD